MEIESNAAIDQKDSEVRNRGKSEQAVAFGQRLKQARLELGMEQQELADLMHVTSRSVGAWEMGDVLPWKRIDEISKILSEPERPRTRYWFLHGEQPAASVGDDRLLQQLISNSNRILNYMEDACTTNRTIASTNQAILDEIRSLRELGAPSSPEDETQLSPSGECHQGDTGCDVDRSDVGGTTDVRE